MSKPTDEILYNEAKNKVDEIYDKPSAYRSMAYTRFYLRAFRDKYGKDSNAYSGNKPGELQKWRNDKWIDVRSFLDNPKDPRACGSVDYPKDEYPYCMPISKARSYSHQQLLALLHRKEELGKKRLVREPYLRDLGLEAKPKIRGRPKRASSSGTDEHKEKRTIKHQKVKDFL
jgi:hypothetical protein